MTDIDGTLDMSKTVDVIVSGYEWSCPKCEWFNMEIKHTKQVQCFVCKRVFETNPPEHVIG